MKEPPPSIGGVGSAWVDWPLLRQPQNDPPPPPLLSKGLAPAPPPAKKKFCRSAMCVPVNLPSLQPLMWMQNLVLP